MTSKKEAKKEATTRFLTPPSTSYFLFGPRGTGKSTWLRERYPEAIRIDLLDPEIHRNYQARPERLKERVDGEPEKRVVVIDEVQKAPSLLDVVHQLIEEGRGLQFVLTGSSARKLRRGAANLLAGRLLTISMHPFLALELKESFDIHQALHYGMVPLVVFAEDPQATLRAYASLYLKEEVQAEALVRDLGRFSRFLEAIAFSQGGMLNLAAVARDCRIGRKTVEGYLSILEDLLLSFRVPIFSKRAKRHLVSHAKFYYFDVGVFRSLRPRGPLDRPEEIGGAALEGLVAQQLRGWLSCCTEESDLYYWRTKSGVEVDFIIYGPSRFLAIEVKHSARIERKDTRSLRAFREDYPEAKAYLLYLGNERLVVDGVPCLPCAEFLLRDLWDLS
uniref:Predicted ATPase, AAA+ superfamily n=1 Tax=Candidatus Kentrum sp. FW TaxID=2126338 RepID=A0A450T757_9GAMM|nr:MAG: Predicted ATPase, AAA+ superfamily [Candidatus Kentron sp. FW]